MKAIIIRHGKVNHIWKKRCSSDEFDEECRLYDIAPIEKMASAAVDAPSKIYISTSDRSLQTAKYLYGSRNFFKTELINEVPLRAAFDTKLKLPTWFWNISGRLQWLINSKRQPETNRQTAERAARFVQSIIDENEDCVIITHGFYMHTLISVMKRNGFNSDGNSVHYKNGEAVIMNLD